jgi:hypothetical protein
MVVPYHSGTPPQNEMAACLRCCRIEGPRPCRQTYRHVEALFHTAFVQSADGLSGAIAKRYLLKPSVLHETLVRPCPRKDLSTIPATVPRNVSVERTETSRGKRGSRVSGLPDCIPTGTTMMVPTGCRHLFKSPHRYPAWKGSGRSKRGVPAAETQRTPPKRISLPEWMSADPACTRIGAVLRPEAR